MLTDHGRALLDQLLHVHQLGVLLEPCYEEVVFCGLLLGVLAQQPGEFAGCGQLGRRRHRGHGTGLAMRMEPLGDQRAGARKTLGLNLAPQARLIRATLRQASLEVRDKWIDFPGASIAALVEREGLGLGPGTDSLCIEATRGSNLAKGLTLGKARLDLRIAMRPCGVPRTLFLLEPRGTPIAGQRPRCGGARWRPLGHLGHECGATWQGLSGRRRLRCLWDGGRCCCWLMGQHTAEGGRDPLQIACQYLVQVTE